MSSEHFHDIKWWLDEYSAKNKNLPKYVILEDGYFPEKWFGIERHLVRCDHRLGLTAENAGLAVEILNGNF